MKNILILGGTRFFGKRLVQLLLDEGHKVTIATRGNTEDGFGDQVGRIQLDRENKESLAKAVENGQEWDTVYDNICYSPQAAQDACDVFKGKVKRYILTSTLSVYEPASRAHEEKDVNPYIYPVTLGGKNDFSYGEGKRLAEAVLFQNADFPVAAARIPIVLGEDDYTGRLEFHIDHVKKEQPIGIPNLDAKMCFISSGEAAAFLSWLKNQRVEGPINARSEGDVKLSELIRWIEKETGKKALITKQPRKEDESPFGVPDSWVMDTSKAQRLGFQFQPLRSWLPALISQLSAVER
ncbi:NAD-dependent epimerase/dehydratase family protein [Paenibacillus chibensis]|uniref:NAD-dependent epimerase/dehydratase family protein n=1 Tax=Paenibacillus chibensis TaxID=59846 RepID=A0ABU6PSA3_9BACL|nr:NAD-dependent epimerase/dehydratase family protein [Paenibacillus chibensis]MEC0373245.1 NAD-dependent epimerase/dehydratase family protein [Paenibacillus chibensis]MED5017758.1 NAD-dependent epimerase/dehydratase family protein [Paenibacillus chibensis]